MIPRRPGRYLTMASWFALGWPLVGYPGLLSILGSRRSRVGCGGARLPSLTVVLPTFNEAANVVARLENIDRSVYETGRLEVIVVDSGSTDGTADRAEAFAASSRLPVRVLRERERRGKAAAINTAIAASTSEVIVITDAPTAFDEHALHLVAEAFGDPEVGTASGYFVVTGEGSALQDEERRFWEIRNRLRILEARVDSTPFLSGELCAFRRELVSRLDEDTLADDMNIALQVRRQGRRVVIVPEARFSERRTASPAELLETKSRRAAGGIQELLRHRDMIGPRYGLFGMLILPSAMLYYLPVRVPAVLVASASALAAWRRMPAPLRLGGVLAGLAAVPVVMRSSRQIWMLLFNEWIFVLGWRRVLTNRMDVRWSQERSTRDTVAIGKK